MNITKEEIKSAGLQHIKDVKGGNACYDSFLAGVEYMQQKLKQCNVSGSLPDDSELKQMFLNRFDCYTEGVTDDGNITEPAMTADRFIKVVKLITGGNDR